MSVRVHQAARPNAPPASRDPVASRSAELGSAGVSEALRSPGRPLAPELRADMAQQLGHRFDHVRVHAGERAAHSAARLGARAYAVGAHIVLGAGEARPGSASYRRLLAHELVHVAQQRASGASPRPTAVAPAGHPAEREADRLAGQVVSGDRSRPLPVSERAQPLLFCQRRPPEPGARRPRAGAEVVRRSPDGGVPLPGGTLTWVLRVIGTENRVTPLGTFTTGATDVEMDARFTASGNGAACRTVTFIQTVIATTGGLPDTADLLFTRDPGSGASVDVLPSETEPYFGVGPQPNAPGLTAEPGQQPGATGRRSAGREAHFNDRPYQSTGLIPPGQVASRQFELAVVCVESGAALGSIRWGYTKTRDPVITLAGGQAADVRAGSASPQHEAARRSFYQGLYDASLSGFARGSARLRADHRVTLRRIARLLQVRQIVLVGASDNSGGREADPRVSLRRAEAARAVLVREGVPAGNIVVEGHGVAARVPNPRGRSVAANRRVDIVLRRGVSAGPSAPIGSPLEAFQLRRTDPRAIARGLVDRILEFRARPRGLAREDCTQLHHQLSALDGWRRRGVNLPDVRQLYGPAINDMLRACPRMPVTLPRYEPPPLEPPDFLRRIREEADDGLR